MEEETKLILQIIDIVINADGKTATETYSFTDKDKKWKIQEVMLGAGPMRKALPWTNGFIKEHTECRAEILENGKLRII